MSQSLLAFKVMESTSTLELWNCRNCDVFVAILVLELEEEERRDACKRCFPPREDVFPV